MVELDLRRIEQLQAQMIVAVGSMEDEAREEEAEIVGRSRGRVDVLDGREVDVGVDDVGVPRQHVAHLLLESFFVPAPQPQEAESARLVDLGGDRIAFGAASASCGCGAGTKKP